jgi:hypothetical protein
MTDRKSRTKKTAAPAPPIEEKRPETNVSEEASDATHGRHTEAFAALLHAAAKTRRAG